MKTSILTAAIFAFMTVPSFAKDLTLEEVRAMSDDELYALAGTISSEDETRLYQQARKEFPEGALGLQSSLNKLRKRELELEACQNALESGTASKVRVLSQIEPGRYVSLLRIIAEPSKKALDMTIDERAAESRRATRETNRVLRDFRECKRKYRKRFGDG